MRRLSPLPASPFSADLNVTPMVDVMLVLLIIFMVVSATALFPVALPQARTAAPAAGDRVTLSIDRAGNYFLQDGPRHTPVTEPELRGRLSAAFVARPGDHVLYLKADDRVAYAAVLAAVDAARAAGVRRLGAITVPEAAAGPR